MTRRGERVRILPPHPAAGRTGQLWRPLHRSDGWWVALDERHPGCPFAADDPDGRANHICVEPGSLLAKEVTP